MWHAAGTNSLGRNLGDVGVQEWRRVIDTNLNGAFICVDAVLPTMRRQGRGTIINIVSGCVQQVTDRTGAAYGASKHGMYALTRSINTQERRHGVRGCAIYPGEVDTEMLSLRANPPTPEQRSQMLKPEDIAAAVVFAASMPQRATVEELAVRPTAVGTAG